MKYSPKKYDNLIRAIYSICLILTVALMLFHPTKGALSSILSSVSLISLFVGMVLFIKYDCTSYEYILIERNSTLDFYVNRIVGKRGSYCVYFPVTDCIEIGLYDEGVRASIRAKYQNSRFSKYVQNFLTGKGFYYALFEGPEFYECVIFEADEAFINNMKEYLGKKPAVTFEGSEEIEASDSEQAIEVSVTDEGNE